MNKGKLMKYRTIALAVAATGIAVAVWAQQAATRPAASQAQATANIKATGAVIRKNLAASLPNLPKIDEVRATPMSGVYEVRMGTDMVYTNQDASYVIQGEMIEIKTQRNLTEERQTLLSAVDFGKLPFRDAFTVVRGNGERKIAVFEDPNCGYCKRFEADLKNLDNITVHVFLLPILGADSQEKSRDIWCSKNKAQTWTAWMVGNQVPPRANCDTSALDRNVAFAQKHRINGTPATFLSDGTRIPGAVSALQLEAMMRAMK